MKYRAVMMNSLEYILINDIRSRNIDEEEEEDEVARRYAPGKKGIWRTRFEREGEKTKKKRSDASVDSARSADRRRKSMEADR